MRKFIMMCFVLSILGQFPMEAKKIELCLQCDRIDLKPGGPKHNKAPVRMPEIYQDGHTLSFTFNHPEYIINIVQDGEVVFSSVVPADAAQYELPGYVSGECVIQFIWGNYCFWAEIEL